MERFLGNVPLLELAGFVVLALAVAFGGGAILGGAAERALERRRRREVKALFDRVSAP